MKGILKQDIGWFDEHPAGQLPTAVTANMAKVQDGLGRKIGDIVLNGISGRLKAPGVYWELLFCAPCACAGALTADFFSSFYRKKLEGLPYALGSLLLFIV